ncbi:MAG: hypothetical protein H6937_00705 [Burkholderiales bacterium]|nr:hypothetical protein [Burkholderiales bacterium]MDR4518356.1 cadmium-containing carbonic anhydrase [Nitrosomonas sp.]
MFKKIKDILGFGEKTMNQENSDQELNFNTLGKFNLGIGNIGPANRSDIDKNILDEMYKRIASGEFNYNVHSSIPVICVDGRTMIDGKRLEAPSAAGGTLSMVYGSDLGNSSIQNEENELQLASKIINKLKQKGFETSVHGDNHSSCGCGACAKVKNIYQHIVERIDDITDVIEQLGISINQDEKTALVQRANQRLQSPGFFSDDRSTVLQAAQANGAQYEELVDAHNELGIAINTRPGTTVNRAAIRETFGPQYDMFIVDTWTFDSAAREITDNSDNQDAIRIAKAMAVQNVATASVLGHASLPIIPIV